MSMYHKGIEDPTNDCHFLRASLDQCHTLVLDPFTLAWLKNVEGFTLLVQEKSLESVGWRTAGPVALLCDFHAASPNFVAQLTAVLSGPESFKLNVDRI
jgi:hypothetical protein